MDLSTKLKAQGWPSIYLAKRDGSCDDIGSSRIEEETSGFSGPDPCDAPTQSPPG